MLKFHYTVASSIQSRLQEQVRTYQLFDSSDVEVNRMVTFTAFRWVQLHDEDEGIATIQ